MSPAGSFPVRWSEFWRSCAGPTSTRALLGFPWLCPSEWRSKTCTQLFITCVWLADAKTTTCTNLLQRCRWDAGQRVVALQRWVFCACARGEGSSPLDQMQATLGTEVELPSRHWQESRRAGTRSASAALLWIPCGLGTLYRYSAPCTGTVCRFSVV